MRSNRETNVGTWAAAETGDIPEQKLFRSGSWSRKRGTETELPREREREREREILPPRLLPT